MKKYTLPVLALAGLLAIPPVVSAEPPPWAPAHGYRNKHHHHEEERQREHHEYREEYREPVAEVRVSKDPRLVIHDGKCNREAVGAVLGGIVGGVIGNQVGRNNGNTEVGTVAGAIIGVVVGKNIGRNMDNRDAGCAAHALSEARDGQTVTWRNPDTGLDFNLTPTETFHRDGVLCRRYRTETVRGGERAEGRSEACRTPDGNWKFGENTRI